LQTAEEQVATGKSVDSPTDNATAYYAAQSFVQQASDLSNVKDNISTSLTTVDSATTSIGSISQVVQQLQTITQQALGTTDSNTRANLATQYNQLLPQLDQLANDSSFNGTNLLNGTSNDLTVYLNASNTASLTISSVDATSNGLGITPITNDFATNDDITAANGQLSNALSTLSTDAANLGSNSTVLQTNQDFASNLIGSLQSASDDLTVADINQEAANLLAVQSQNQLGIISLSISGQLAQATLGLFGGSR
jgi:flagellin-like hook-associated protein FlgL